MSSSQQNAPKPDWRRAIRGELHILPDTQAQAFLRTHPEARRLYDAMKRHYRWHILGYGGHFDAPYDGPNTMLFDMEFIATVERIDNPSQLLAELTAAGIFLPETP